MSRLTLFAFAALLGLMAPASRAEVVANTHYGSAMGFYDPYMFVPLTPGGDTEWHFQAPSAGQHVIGFSAGCAATSNNMLDLGGIEIDVIVNGSVVRSTRGSGDLLCSINGIGPFRPSMASVMMVAPLKVGKNSIRVRATRTHDALGGQISVPTLIVWR